MRLFLSSVEKDNAKRVIILGKVTDVKDGSGTAKDRVLNVSVTGTVWNAEEKKEEEKTVSLGFWNSEMANMRDRAIQAKIAPGTIAMFDVTEKDGKYYVNSFKYQGAYTVHYTGRDGSEKEKNIFFGPVSGFTDNEKYVRVSIPVEDASKNVDWKQITFWEPTEEGRQNVAERARKCLAPKEGMEKKPRAAIICSEAKPYISNTGEDRCSYNGFDFVLVV